ncbi:MAG TPA: cytochrome P450, partial [Actinomycetota bacterium]
MTGGDRPGSSGVGELKRTRTGVVASAQPVRRPPGPPPSPTNLVASRRNPLRFLKRAASFGDLTFIQLGRGQFYLVVSPDYIQDIMVTNPRKFSNPGTFPFLGNGILVSEGEYHRRQRTIMKPAFHHTAVPAYAKTMAECTARIEARWQDGEERDIHADMNMLTLAIVCQCLFSTDIDEEAERLRSDMATVMELAGQVSGAFGPISRQDALSSEGFQESFAAVDAWVYGVIARRRRDPGESSDILSLLMQAQDDLTDEQIRDEMLALMVAGHETTANALSWTWYELSQRPEIEAKLQAEADQVLGGRLPTFEDLPLLQYTQMVISEALRMYPPVPVSARWTLEDHELGGYTIPAGSALLLAEYVVHRDPRWWPDPDRFDPERWRPDARSGRPKFSYFPFGGGPR